MKAFLSVSGGEIRVPPIGGIATEFSAESLAEALDQVQEAVEKNSTIPILSGSVDILRIM
jgi:hypothetical protein